MKTLLALFAVVLLTGCDGFAVPHKNAPVEISSKQFQDHFGCPHTDSYCGTVEFVLTIAGSTTPLDDPILVTFSSVAGIEYLTYPDKIWLPVMWPMIATYDPATMTYTGLIPNAAEVPFWQQQTVTAKYARTDWDRYAHYSCDWVNDWTITGAIITGTCTVRP